MIERREREGVYLREGECESVQRISNRVGRIVSTFEALLVNVFGICDCE